MKIRFYPPFQAPGEDACELHLEKEMPLREFCALLVTEFPRLREFLPKRDNGHVDLLSNVFFVTNSKNPAKLLSPSDTVRDEDFLQILPPFDGG